VIPGVEVESGGDWAGRRCLHVGAPIRIMSGTRSASALPRAPSGSATRSAVDTDVDKAAAVDKLGMSAFGLSPAT
jgi:hypothetical protein